MTVLPVTWIASGATFSRRSAAAAVSVGGEVQTGDRGDDAAVHLFGPGMMDVAGPQASLDMRNGDAAMIGGERGGHCRGGVTLNDDPVRPLGVHDLS